MSTSAPQKPHSPSPPLSPTAAPTDQTKLLHNAALAGLIICPAIILLPPRKFDLYTIALLSGTFVSANHLTYEYSGRSFVTRWSDRLNSFSNIGELPPKAVLVQERLRRDREARGLAPDRKLVVEKLGAEEPESIAQQVERKRAEERGVLKKVWYGQEGADWKTKRDQREKEALEDGKGYSGLIMDQIWEVWNWGGKSAEGLKAKDEEVVRERKEKEERERENEKGRK
jgi:hypothetical protein